MEIFNYKKDKDENQKEFEEMEMNKNNKKQKKRKEFIVYYSSYGYIKIMKSEVEKNNKLLKFIQYRQIPYRPEDCLKGTIYFEKLTKNINIKIKTFFDERSIFIIEKIDIYSPLNLAVQKLFEQINKTKKKEIKEKITSKSQYRIYSCNKRIHQLNQMECIYENNIKDNELLLYLPINDLSFSEFIKGNSIIINKECKIATKINTDDHQYILGNIFYSLGKHYFEINLLTEPITGLNLSDSQKMISINGKKERKTYIKETFTINDSVGTLLEFKKEGLEITFYKNNKCLGVAYNKIKNDKIFYPAISLGLIGTKVQISNQIDFP